MSESPINQSKLTAAQAITGAAFLTTGIGHFVIDKFFVAIVPKSLPNPEALVAISGVAEIAGGVGVLVPQTRRLAGLGLIALLVAVFPANINMAANADKFDNIPAWALWARLPLQFGMILGVWRATQPRA